MGSKPIPQIRSFGELGQLVNQYSAGEFLTNRQVFGTNQDGLLEVLLNGYNNLPPRAKILAENLFASKFGHNAAWLNDKLRSLPGGKSIPVNVAQAQAIIRSITADNLALSKDKSKLTQQLQELNTKVKSIQDSISSYRGGLQDLTKIQNNYDRTLAYIDLLRNTMEGLNEDKFDLEAEITNLKAEIAALKTAGASSATIAPIEQARDKALKDLADANDALADGKATLADHIAEINRLEVRIAVLEKAVPKKDQIQILFTEYDTLIKTVQDFYNDEVATKTEITLSDRNKFKLDGSEDLTAFDETLLTDVIDQLTQIIENIKTFGAGFSNQWYGLETRWQPLQAAATALQAADKENKDDALKETSNKIDQKSEDLIKIRDDAIRQVAHSAIITRLKAIINEYANLDQTKTTLDVFSNPKTTLKQLFDQPNIIDQIPDKQSQIKQLETGRDTIKQFAADAKSITKSLNEKVAIIKAEYAKLTDLNPIQINAYNAIIQVLDGYYTENTTKWPVRFAELINLIETKIDNIPIIIIDGPQFDPLVEEIRKFLHNLPDLTEMLAKEMTMRAKDKKDPAVTVDALELDVQESRESFNRAERLIKEFQGLQTRATATVNAEATKELDKAAGALTDLERIRDQAKENTEEIEQAIKDKKGGGVVSDVHVDMDDYSLSFKIGNVLFEAEADSDIKNTAFAANMAKDEITENAAQTAGQDVAKKTTEQSQLGGIWGSIINDVYKIASNNDNAQKKIRSFIRPIFAAYKFAKAGNNEDNTYKTDLSFYGLKDEDITRNLVG